MLMLTYNNFLYDYEIIDIMYFIFTCKYLLLLIICKLF